MSIEELQDLFDKHFREAHQFHLVENKKSARSDLHAFILLDCLCPAKRGESILCSAEHDQVFLGVELADLAHYATEANIIELIRCGVRYDRTVNSLALFV